VRRPRAGGPTGPRAWSRLDSRPARSSSGERCQGVSGDVAGGPGFSATSIYAVLLWAATVTSACRKHEWTYPVDLCQPRSPPISVLVSTSVQLHRPPPTTDPCRSEDRLLSTRAGRSGRFRTHSRAVVPDRRLPAALRPSLPFRDPSPALRSGRSPLNWRASHDSWAMRIG